MNLTAEKKECMEIANQLYKHLGEHILARCYAKINSAKNSHELARFMGDLRRELLWED